MIRRPPRSTLFTRRSSDLGEGVYLVGFECQDIPGAVAHLKKEGARADQRRGDIAWVHPQDAHGEIGRAHSELQSRQYLVCRLLLEKKKIANNLESPAKSRQ